MSTLNEITSEADFSAQLNALPPSALLVLYFHTPWAAPCAHMRTVLATLASQYPVTTPAAIAFLSINAEELPDISEEYDVSAVPYTVLARNGSILESVSGTDAAKVRDAVERHAGRASNNAAAAAAAASIPPALTAVPRDNAPAMPATQAPLGAASASSTTTPALTPEQNKEALFARLAQLVKAAPVMLFMKGTPSVPQCGFSRQLVGILRENSIKYGFFNILADEDVRQGLKEFADWPTFPQLWVKGELVGGLDIVKEELENDPSFMAEFSVNRAA
ncbi:hypothetical protein ASPZODRAFT_16800 [Penicilliopsis zonata CBS 506.65]|uniref:Thioredoxin domain-containing protein n=1 Tax=Penicilliopsis zonata CBS 506.65 TaxID=1073090 RepID=A0A1L9SGB8_9EURO|nr:hypothetical protein ASPZODRAFT_16800 [Penicilliopsis zonata CBS 506.65]OJJ46206.1 hypothetical protein ASPZODRAFT_16800 [Penicilliopsis zonata CBS 506.65]